MTTEEENQQRNKFVIIAYSTTATALDSMSSIPTLLCRSPRLTFIYSQHYSSGAACVCVWCLASVGSGNSIFLDTL